MVTVFEGEQVNRTDIIQDGRSNSGYFLVHKGETKTPKKLQYRGLLLQERWNLLHRSNSREVIPLLTYALVSQGKKQFKHWSLSTFTTKKMNNPAGGSRETIILDLDEGGVEGRGKCLGLYSGRWGTRFPVKDPEDIQIENN